MSGASEYTWRSEWLSTLCIDFTIILPNVRPKRDFKEAAMTTDSKTHVHTPPDTLTCIERRRIDILEIRQVDNDRSLLGAPSDGFIDLPTPILGIRNLF